MGTSNSGRFNKWKMKAMSFSIVLTAFFFYPLQTFAQNQVKGMKAGFLDPPASARPGVYWYFMDGNMSAKSITSDLESMKKAGIGNVIFLEVNVGIPRGFVDFLSEEWQQLFAHLVKESKRLGIEITLGIGPGWTGSGGPWVKPEASMQHLISSELMVSGDTKKPIILPVPPPKAPYFGEGAFTPELKKEWLDYYEDVAVLAYPTPSETGKQISDIDEKALYYRAPFSSVNGVKQYLPFVEKFEEPSKNEIIAKGSIIDLTDKMQKDGKLNWKVPKGNWTIVRFVSRNNGAITRPAPVPGLGFESDKFDSLALESHLQNYVGKLIEKTGKPSRQDSGGLKRLHMDSWEMGAQNWTRNFRKEFTKRMGYDPLPFYPVYAGNVVQSAEISERFLWDLRQTAQELILEYHAGKVKKYAHQNNLDLSIEPYDMNPTADLELGAVADVPMAEFWSKGFGYNSSFSCIEATSVGHVNGKSLIPAEAFTAGNDEGWRQYPGSMKNQGDWAFAAGINRFVYHTFQNQFLADSLRPGATMGPYGVHWDRNQTWWPMVGAYHSYISRCQYMLQQGRAVADILYLSPEGSPHVFRPPVSAMDGNDTLPDRRGYNFDGCSPNELLKAQVRDGMIEFPGGTSYKMLVLPVVKTMNLILLKKIASLIYAGALVVGSPPERTPGLSNYPACDQTLRDRAESVWGDLKVPEKQTVKLYGEGKIVWGGKLSTQIDRLYPEYDLTAEILLSTGLQEDFTSNGQLRYTHRRTDSAEIYFVSNRTAQRIQTQASFRSMGTPQLWDPATGETRNLPEFLRNDQQTIIPLILEAYQSFFVVFNKYDQQANKAGGNFPEAHVVEMLKGPWQVSFDPKWGGPEHSVFQELADWATRPENGIKYYSGTATYRQSFDLPRKILGNKDVKYALNLGSVSNLARVRLNGIDLGVLWTAPWKVDITEAMQKHNRLEIDVINLWPNRLIGDEQRPDDGVKDGKWPGWMLDKQPRTSGRFSFSSHHFYSKDSPLLKSGLLGPVSIEQTAYEEQK